MFGGDEVEQARAAGNLPSGRVKSATVVQAERFVQEARVDLERLQAALQLAREEVARAKLDLAKAKEDLERLRRQSSGE